MTTSSRWASNQNRARIGIHSKSPKDLVIKDSIFPTSSNEIENEALTMGLQLAKGNCISVVIRLRLYLSGMENLSLKINAWGGTFLCFNTKYFEHIQIWQKIKG